jgi:chromosome segregation ATPase
VDSDERKRQAVALYDQIAVFEGQMQQTIDTEIAGAREGLKQLAGRDDDVKADRARLERQMGQVVETETVGARQQLAELHEQLAEVDPDGEFWRTSSSYAEHHPTGPPAAT